MAASTHRPNYPHLFQQASHNHHPSQTETFLGQITIESPAELPPEFNSRFKPSTWNQQGKKQQNDANSIPKFAPEAVDQNIDFLEPPKENSNAVPFDGVNKEKILNHRTRVFAPKAEAAKYSRGQVKDYFVNNNGDVFITTKTPFVPKATTPQPPAKATTEKRNSFVPSTKSTGKPLSFNIRSNKKPFVPKNFVSTSPKNTFNLESLLEEPIDNTRLSEHDDDVEVIKFATAAPEEAVLTTVQYEQQHVADDSRDSEYYDYDTTEAEEEVHTTNVPEINTEHNEDPAEFDETKDNDVNTTNTKQHPLNESSYDVLTMKPSTMVKDDNFKEFIDSTVIDSTTEDPVFSTSLFVNVPAQPEVEETELPPTEEDTSNPNDDTHLIGGAVVSVVTTKSVINNTLAASITPSTISGPQVSSPSPLNIDNSTDTWVVVASVQTSRSVSGARYLPSAVVEQDERTKLLNEPLPEEEGEEEKEDGSAEDKEEEGEEENKQKGGVHENEEDQEKETDEEVEHKEQAHEEEEAVQDDHEENKEDTDTSDHDTATEAEEEITTIHNEQEVVPTTKQKTSTESLIDKLDRVQSDLSSGFLSGGFKNGNNIAVITEGMSDKMDETTMLNVAKSSTTVSTTEATTTTTQKSSLPAVVIKKFSSNSRPSSTARPIKKIFDSAKQDDLSGLLPPGFKTRYRNNRKTTTTTTTTTSAPEEELQNDEPVANTTTGRSSKNSFKNKVQVQDVSAFLPPGYKLETEKEKEETPKILEDLLTKIKFEDVSHLLPPGYKPPEDNKNDSRSQNPLSAASQTVSDKPAENKTKSVSGILKNVKEDDISSFLPPGYKNRKTITTTTQKPKGLLANTKPLDISAFLPPGYKPPSDTGTENAKGSETILSKAKPVEDISALLPPGYKPPKLSSTTTTKPKGVESLLKEAKPVDISAFLPPGFKLRSTSTTEKPNAIINTTAETAQSPPPNLLPPGYKAPTETSKSSSTSSTSSTSGGFKVVFPSRPGAGSRKTGQRLTTAKSSAVEVTSSVTSPTIHKGWPSR